jgi:histidinol phosphatase-like PHP family hydrolase
MHTHTFWSDGDDFPESVAKWYKENNYDFLVFTDHNILLETPTQGPVRGSHQLIDGELWQRLSKDHPAVEKYVGYFGEEWADISPQDDDNVLIRLRPLDEFRDMFEEPESLCL